MRNRTKLLLLTGLTSLFILLYLFYDLNGSYSYALPRRGVKVVAMLITGAAIAYATVVFQTITHNRILTPSIMGLDSLYQLLQTSLIFMLGSTHIALINKQVNFFLSTALMIGFALLLYHTLFRKGNQPIYFLLLVGIVIGTFFGSISTFMQVLIDPNEFLRIQDRMFASFNNVGTDLVWIALVLTALLLLWSWRSHHYLDVVSLGRDTALNLGVPYDSLVRKMLIVSAILIAISTALVGPITFFGLIVANLSYQFMKSYKHNVLVLSAMLMSFVALIGGQFLVERVFQFSTTLSVIINFVGGVYFIYLLLKESRSK